MVRYNLSINTLQVNLVYSVTCQALVRAKTHCDVLMINNRDVVKALQHFPNGNVTVYM